MENSQAHLGEDSSWHLFQIFNVIQGIYAAQDMMEEQNIARMPRPVHHRIPNFDGADAAAAKLCALPEFLAGQVAADAETSCRSCLSQRGDL